MTGANGFFSPNTLAQMTTTLSGGIDRIFEIPQPSPPIS